MGDRAHVSSRRAPGRRSNAIYVRWVLREPVFPNDVEGNTCSESDVDRVVDALARGNPAEEQIPVALGCREEVPARLDAIVDAFDGDPQGLRNGPRQEARAGNHTRVRSGELDRGDG